MVDACTITRVTDTVTNPDGTVTKTTETVYTGKCRIQTYDPYESRPEVADVQVTLRRDVLQIPMSVTGITTGDEVQVTASQLDPDLVGRRWRIAGPSRKTHQTMRRMYIEEDTQPREEQP